MSSSPRIWFGDSPPTPNSNGYNLDRITDMLIRSVGNEAKLDARAKELAKEEGRLMAELEALPDVPQMVARHPAAIASYEEALGRLDEAPDACTKAGDPELASALRDLVDTITVGGILR